MTDIKPISPSQIKTWQTCQRKWGYVYLEGKREPGTPSTELGTAVHAHLEAYYRDGVMPTAKDRAGEIALAYLAADITTEGFNRWKDGQVETPFEIGNRWRGIIDLRHGCVVRDHKTTSDLKWALTEETLRHDPQGVIYAQAVFEDRYEMVGLQWHYVTTRPPYKTKKVHLTVYNDDDHKKRFAQLEEINKLMQSHHAKGSTADALPREESACNKYGGCFHRSYCQPSPVKAFDLNMENPTSHPNPAIERAKADGWTVHPKSALHYFKGKDVVKLGELVATYEAILKQEAAEAVPALPLEPEAPALPEAQPINPPAEDFVAPKAEAEMDAAFKKAVEGIGATPVSDAPKPRGRPKKTPEEKAHDEANKKQAEEAPIDLEKLKRDFANAPIVPATTGDTRVLYVDCIPMNFSRPTDLVRLLLDEACPAIEKANDVAHWKQIPYGGGTAALVIAARQVLTKTRGDLFLDTRTEEGQAVLAAAVHFMNAEGGVVVRGLR